MAFVYLVLRLFILNAMKRAGQILILPFLLVAVLLTAPTISCQSYRDERVEPERLLNILAIKEGMKIGEAGAGSGYLTMFLAEKVGSSGHIYANDIDENVLRRLENNALSKGFNNITTVLGVKDDPKFPAEDLEMIVMLRAFHEFENKVEWLINASPYLAKDGSLIILDGWFDDGRTMTKEFIEDVAEKSGYRLESYDPYLSNLFIFKLKLHQQARQ